MRYRIFDTPDRFDEAQKDIDLVLRLMNERKEETPMLNTDEILNLIAATAALAARDGDKMTWRVLAAVAKGSRTEPVLPLALRYVRTAEAAALSPRVRSALRTVLDLAEGFPVASFAVRLLDAGPNKISAVLAVRKLTGLDLGEAKRLVESAPADVKAFDQRANAEVVLRALADKGYRAEIVVVARNA